MRRVRFHQAWYRTEVMRLMDFGRLFGSGELCGTVLTDLDAVRMMNFIGGDAARHYQFRRTQGWGVDPVRCTKYMTSSQTLTFNMLGQAVTRPTQCAELFNALLGRDDLSTLERYDFEFSPAGTQYSLGDRTLIDLLLRFQTRDNDVQVVGVETKLADRFSTRGTAAMGGEHYRRIQESFVVWRNMTEALAHNQTRQLVRCHALAHSVQLHESPVRRTVPMLTLLHPNDHVGHAAASAYQACVVDPKNSPVVKWDAFLGKASGVGAISDVIVKQLYERYVDLSSSQAMWSTWVSRGLTNESRRKE